MVALKSHPALIIVDMQNGFCHTMGTFAKLGMPVHNQLAVVPTINKLRQFCHSKKIPVFFTRLSFSEDYSDAGILLDDLPAIRDMKGFIRKSWDADILDELKPSADEVVLDKTRNTAFYQTDFAEQLKQRGINQLIVTGVGTNVCVESTVRDAVTIGFHSVTVSDATATLTEEDHQASLRNLKWFGGTASAKEIEEALQKV